MLMSTISDSYRGIQVSVGVRSNDGAIYVRLKFVGESWNALIDRSEVDAEFLSNALLLGVSSECVYDKAEDGKMVFIWFAHLRNFEDGTISMFTILADVFRRIDMISPMPRGSILHPVVKAGFKEFVKSYAFKDEKEQYTNGSMLIPMFRVFDALDMIETGRFGYNGSFVNVGQKKIAPADDEKKEEPVQAKRKASKPKSKKLAKIGK